jgi:hypothetical protein
LSNEEKKSKLPEILVQIMEDLNANDEASIYLGTN